MGNKEKRFLDALEALFTGAEVDGESGFINLMRIKRGYFQSIRPELMKEIDTRAAPDTAFREELFDKLHTFFSRYFCESGSIYFRHLPAFSKTYERVYADGEEVALSWKTRDLYYVKSDVLVKSMPVTLQDDRGNTVHFYFDASAIEHKQNNERREFVFDFIEVKKTQVEQNRGWHRQIHLKASYSKKGKKTKTNDILRRLRQANIRLADQDLHKAIAVFKRQTEADYFIHKDAGGFLREQFYLWLYQYMFWEENIFQEDRLSQLQAIRDTAYDVIHFIAQFEDELRRVWEKPKFVRNVNYVVTLDKLPADLLIKIAKHQGIEAQIKEWRQLGLIDQTFTPNAITDDGNQHLPLDTKHLKALEQDILNALGNLDEALDGELVHSENWQTLNTLKKRYKEKVKCIYIDPPFNLDNSDQFDYRTNYKNSCWATLLENRLALAPPPYGYGKHLCALRL